MRFHFLILVFAFSLVSPSRAQSSRSQHTLDLDVTMLMPELMSGELRITSVRNFEFGAGAGGLPINSWLNSVYTFTAIPLNLSTGDTYNIYPTGTYALSDLYLFVNWHPTDGPFFIKVEFANLTFTSNISGALKDETLGTSTAGAVTGTVTVQQPILTVGPGYQVYLNEHFHIDFAAGIGFLLGASSSTTTGGSISSFVALDASAAANYAAAKAKLASSVSQAMATYQATYHVIPSVSLSLGYLF